MGFCCAVRRAESQRYGLLPLSHSSFLCVCVQDSNQHYSRYVRYYESIDFLYTMMIKCFSNKLLFYLQLYREDEQRGNIMMAFSSDSTCTTDLYNASYGHMTWNLTTIPSVPWPSTISNSKCRYSVSCFPHQPKFHIQSNLVD